MKRIRCKLLTQRITTAHDSEKHRKPLTGTDSFNPKSAPRKVLSLPPSYRWGSLGIENLGDLPKDIGSDTWN